MSQKTIENVDEVTIRFAGDSGDGMQLTGTQFTNTTAILGNDLSTFPDYPAEIRAPAGTLFGVSGFQIHFGSTEIHTPGDHCDVLVAMNPAALKVNLGSLLVGGSIIVNTDGFNDKNLKLAGYAQNPLKDGSLEKFRLYEVDISKLTALAIQDLNISSKFVDRSKNFFALGMMYWMYGRPLETTIEWLKEKFKDKPDILEANIRVLKAGWNFSETTEIFSVRYDVAPAKLTPGRYRNITGNQAVAWGFMAAARKANLELFLGSYPITPASDILHELSLYKSHGVKTFQAEDEIAGISSAIGASFGGALGITTTSGPGVALKTEAIGLAVMVELPLVICNVQRGGPSTGLPTKTEQADLLQAIYGRNGEAPVPVIAAATPSDCFGAAFEASQIALKYMTPVILLTDGDNNIGELDPVPAADLAAALGVKIYTIGLGQEGACPLPAFEPNTGKLRFAANGEIIPTITLQPPNYKVLDQMARMTRGRSYRAANRAELAGIYNEIDRLEKTDVKLRRYTRHTTLFQWPLAAALAVVSLEQFLATTWLRRLP